MNTSSFKANSWLKEEGVAFSMPESSNGVDPEYKSLPPPMPERSLEFSPSLFFTPGWTGEGLISKRALSIKKTLHLLWNDAKRQFVSHDHFNKTLKLSIYNQFLSFLQTKGKDGLEISTYSLLWEHIQDPNSPFKQDIQEFIDIYTFRCAAIFLFKLKFIIKLCRAIGFPLHDNSIISPNSLLAKIFRKGSSTDLNCEALQSNQYSWYRPTGESISKLSEIKEYINEISIIEMMKICTYRNSMDSLSGEWGEGRFSHSLSHKTFGLFLNDLILQFPKWLTAGEEKTSPISRKNSLRPINVKYMGDHLFSLSQSHWLAQESNLNSNWNSVICPDFFNQEFQNGHFLRICHELQYLSFLVSMAVIRSEDPCLFICKIIHSKISKSKDNELGQFSLFSHSEVKGHLLYDRIVINFNELPKRNPHHSLLSHITEQVEHLTSTGLIYVFSNQNLFVPSQSEKIEQLLKVVKLEGHFNFQELFGKGEIPDFLYIFCKNSLTQNSAQQVGWSSPNPFFDMTTTGSDFGKSKKVPCLTFRLKGDLQQFSHFSLCQDEISTFLRHKSPNIPVYQTELKNGLSLEFFQDAILDGKLVHSATNDTGLITYPNFFKRLTQSCVGLETFFVIESLSQGSETQSNEMTDHLLGVKIRQGDRFPFLLIANFSNPENVVLEIIRNDAYQAKVEKYGVAFYQYFGLLPKRSDININILRSYLNSDIGKQVIQISLNGGQSKFKAKLRSLLIPKFLCESIMIPESRLSQIKFLATNIESLLEVHPEKIESEFHSMIGMIQELAKEFPWHTLGLLSHFKSELQGSIEKLKGESKIKMGSAINYNNPLILNPLMKLKKHSLYPKNPDVYLDFKLTHRDQLQGVLTDRVFGTQDGQDYLALFSDGVEIVRLFSGISLLKFLNFILNSANNVPISQILLGLKIPSLSELAPIIESFLKMEENLNKLIGQTKELINRIITRQIGI